MLDLSFYKNKKVLVTGHTGFKGTWLCKGLIDAGSKVIGYSMDPPTEPSLYDLSGVGKYIEDIRGDIRDMDRLRDVFRCHKPEIVIHMAAQTIVLASYEKPRETYETNIMGTVNILECVKGSESVKAFLNITTDKVYRNKEADRLTEDMPLDGWDPYSNSKSCSDIITGSYMRSFGEIGAIGVGRIRSGNVIGGGDFGDNRMIPDCVRAASRGAGIKIRNPLSTRPYQHILDVMNSYLIIARALYEKPELAGSYNVGPDYGATANGELVEKFCRVWEEKTGEKVECLFEDNPVSGKEAGALDIDSSLGRDTFGLASAMSIDDAVEEVVDFTLCRREGGDILKYMEKRIDEYWRRR